jgi:hypothetical protein
LPALSYWFPESFGSHDAETISNFTIVSGNSWLWVPGKMPEPAKMKKPL